MAPPRPVPPRAPGALRIGMSAAFTGPNQSLANSIRAGIEACFQLTNRLGGVNGTPLELIARDDGYEPGRTASNMRRLVTEEQVFGILGSQGTSTAAVAIPIANEKKIPFFAPFTGAALARKTPPDHYVVNVRASYAEESTEIIRGLVEDLHIAPAKLAFFTQDDAYGDAGWSAAVAALQRIGFADAEHLPHGRYPRNTVDVDDAVAELLDPRLDVEAVVMVGVHTATTRFVRLARLHGLRAIFVGLSEGSEDVARALGREGEGIVFTQVLPPPEGDSDAARAFQAALPRDQRNYASFEGFVSARAFVAGLRLAGPDATGERLLSALEAGAAIDLGLGGVYTLSPTEHQLSHRAWLTVIRDGKIAPLTSWRWLPRGGRS